MLGHLRPPGGTLQWGSARCSLEAVISAVCSAQRSMCLRQTGDIPVQEKGRGAVLALFGMDISCRWELFHTEAAEPQEMAAQQEFLYFSFLKNVLWAADQHTTTSQGPYIPSTFWLALLMSLHLHTMLVFTSNSSLCYVWLGKENNVGLCFWAAGLSHLEQVIASFMLWDGNYNSDSERSRPQLII